MAQRIRLVGNELDRKKNRFDPLNEPVRIFRKNKDDAEKVSLAKYKDKIDARAEAERSLQSQWR